MTKMDEIRFVEMVVASSYLRNICESQIFEMVRISYPMMEVASLFLRSNTSFVTEDTDDKLKNGLLSKRPWIEHEL